jgi:hypothetical protein
MIEVRHASGNLSDFGAKRVRRLSGRPPREMLDVVNRLIRPEQITNHPFISRDRSEK